MDAQQFLAEFGYIANAPGGVDRLRELILDLAIRGELLGEQSKSSKAESLISEIIEFRAKLIQDGKLRRPTPLPEIDDSELSFKLPANWAFERLGNICEIVRGVTFPASKKQTLRTDDVVACLRTSNVQAEVDWSDLIFINPGLVKRDDQWIELGDTVISMANSYELVGKVALVKEVKERATFGGFIAAIRPHVIAPEYLYLVLRSPYMQSRMRVTASQTTNIANISLGGMRPIPTPIPPKEEQSRIVAKVDELMALCDQLAALQQKRRTLQNHLRQATLQAVAASQSPHELQESWQRLQANFGQLFSAPEDVVAFKGLILDLAVSGNLSDVEYRHHSTGAELLEAIAERRISWSHEAESQEKKEAQTMLKKLRTQQVNPPETNLPVHWAWATFLQVSQAVVDCHNKTAPYVANGIHLVRTTDIRNGEMNLTNTKKVTEETFDYWSRRMPPKAGDIFFTREAPMGEAAIVPEGEKVCLGQRTMLLRLFPELFNNRFLLYVIRSPSFQTRMVEAAIGMTVKHLRVGGVEDLVVPVPPKPEQDAIVSIIDALFEICDRFEKQLSKKQRISENLVTSSVAALTGIAIEQEEEPMKAPQTELVAPVRLGTPPDVKAQAPLATILARHNGEMSAKDLWQRFGGEIDAFYAQLKAEVAHGWLLEPAPAEMREKAES
ncbi:restriction endonuclease subunit S [Vibrio cholerae]|uniref:restriction endonuclease subunit S n=2 Tax=Vibrio cholerae TaxID=666 RepID=UPI00053C0E14|nr:restriction endonuclease subunit S [Vibrio cholerae]EGQ9205993.1 restriction endonuclease subunit S [Vibrio cholerae]EGQ9332334.1 restriction endonuclease subunit S [Vibrio cholerae]EGR0443659.1 restriction endonuclease subunit S [Vibrio cholerae]EGR0452316.1 restriction endonuclease subunit S [Vibrio cholerae]EGR2502099.1 restriction endonuclease subunit S [Vibrio cholerae]